MLSEHQDLLSTIHTTIRSKLTYECVNDVTAKVTRKRKADQLSPLKGKSCKRSALSDISVNGVTTDKKGPILVNNHMQALYFGEKPSAVTNIGMDLNGSINHISEAHIESMDARHERSAESSLYTSTMEDLKSPQAESNVLDQEDETDSVSDYAMEIFQYMKDREKSFQVRDYMPKQVWISKCVRAALIDWMVDVQIRLRLNHETLYLAVKIMDLYLNRVMATRKVLKLCAIASLSVASKYDKQTLLLIKDFLDVCDYAFTREEIIQMEMNVLRVIGFNLCVPLSYKFLRRFAQCSGATAPTLITARYILELSLLEYHFVLVSESKMASAALYVALRMNRTGYWTPTLEYYSGYKLSNFMTIALQLNAMLHKKPNRKLRATRIKYSQDKFYEVANVPLIEDTELY